jgi:hypothetical protein
MAAPRVSKPKHTSAGPARRAEVVLDLDVESGMAHLVLANCGDAVATNVRVEFSRTLTGVDGVVVSALPVFKQLGVLRPGRTLRILWDAAPSLLARREEAAPFSATVSWSERLTRTRQRAEYHHDPSTYRHWPESST